MYFFQGIKDLAIATLELSRFSPSPTVAKKLGDAS